MIRNRIARLLLGRISLHDRHFMPAQPVVPRIKSTAKRFGHNLRPSDPLGLPMTGIGAERKLTAVVDYFRFCPLLRHSRPRRRTAGSGGNRPLKPRTVNCKDAPK